MAERAGTASRLRRTRRVVRYGRREDLRRLRGHERAAVVDVVEEGLHSVTGGFSNGGMLGMTATDAWRLTVLEGGHSGSE